ncbi:MAG: hypothetical protein Q7J30_01685 [Candidatus Azambacteria bacterium]|nr:hypothetical protein [Candidatus Azambacteria bacterium]
MATLIVGKVVFGRKSDKHYPELLVEAQKRIKEKELETRLAAEIQSVAELLKENQRLETELEETKKQRDCWRKLYRKIKPDEKVPCDRQKAMVVHGELDISEVLHGSFGK